MLSYANNDNNNNNNNIDNNSRISIQRHIQGGLEKTAQNLMHYNFSTAGHRVTRFPSKCSETNW